MDISTTLGMVYDQNFKNVNLSHIKPRQINVICEKTGNYKTLSFNDGVTMIQIVINAPVEKLLKELIN